MPYSLRVDPILDDLNDAQRKAVLFGDGPLMVLAGAGSGKTRVITRRIARLIRDGADPYSILALTFTNKAATEMRERVLALGGGTVQVSTFHAACARFLRRDIEVLGWPRDFTIYDTYDRDQCIKALMHEHGVHTKIRPADVGREISKLKNLHIKPHEHRPRSAEIDLLVAQIYPAYEARMKRSGALDFDDLLIRFLDLLREHPEVAERYQRRFEHVLVDEFQDTNRVQYELTKGLLGPKKNVCVVGDPDQSIYKFRGAELRNMLDFARDFPSVVVIRLEQNYRSKANILRAAEAVIANNQERLEKNLVTDAPPGPLLRVQEEPTPQDEAEMVGKTIANLVREGVSPDEIAVFYRTHFLSRAVEEALRHRGIPYEVVGGWAFFERREIKDMLAYLRVAQNPLDEVSFERIVNVPSRGLGDAAIDKLRTLAREQGMSLVEAIAQSSVRAAFAKKQQHALTELALTFERVREEGKAGVAAALRLVLVDTDYVGWACKLGEPEDEARKENLDELVNDAVVFDSGEGGGLAEYLQHVSLLTNEDRAKDQGPRVSLMTVHSAKGLEFEHVFVIGLEDGLFPHSRSRDNRAELEEERRLMYVALTRAKEALYLSSVEERMVNGSFSTQTPSRFLDEIPEDLTDGTERRFENWERDEDDADFDGSQESDAESLRVGSRVWHEVYGKGVVRAIMGTGIQTRALVNFEKAGEKTLVLEWAKLVVIPGDTSDES